MSDYDILQRKIEALESAINVSREQFSAQLGALKDELGALRKLSAATPEISQPAETAVQQDKVNKDTLASAQVNKVPASEAEPSTVTTSTVTTSTAAASRADQPADTPYRTTSGYTEEQKTSENKATENTSTENTSQRQQAPEEQTQEARTQEAQTSLVEAEPGFVSMMLSNAAKSIIAYLLSSLSIFAAPMHELYHRLIKLYSHYQKQGKAPVFLMTLGGLITLTVGFGYLLQYSFSTLFNDTLKALTGFVIGAGIIGLGVLLSKKETVFKDYAASVIALGLIFNYLTAYFIGPYYGIVGETTGFMLLLAVTLVSFSLAIIFETRVVSAITLIGGVFMPFIVGDAQSAGLVFLAYLLVLSLGNLYLSHRIKWPTLATITFFLSLSVIKFTGISDTVYPLAAIALLSGFFYAYIGFWSFNGLRLKESLSKQDLTILVANVFYFIYVIMQLKADDYLIAGTFIVHAVLLAGVIKALHLIKSSAGPIYMLMLGLLVASAVFVLAPADVTSIVWAIEGLAMLYIGFRYNHRLIRAEGYVIYTVAMLGLLWQGILAFDSALYSGVAWHWINLAAFGALSFVAYRIIYTFKGEATATELKAAFIQNEIFTFWGALAFSLVIVWNTHEAMAVLAVVPLLWCFYRAARHQLKFAQFSGYLLALVFAGRVLFGMFDVGSTIITEQSVISWLALLELLVFVWGITFYYQRYELSGRGKALALKLHRAFFYLPLVFIISGLLVVLERNVFGLDRPAFSTVWFDFVFIAGLIISAQRLISLSQKFYEPDMLAHYRYILKETSSLLISTLFLYTVAILSPQWMFNAAMLPLLYLLHRGTKEKLPLTELLAWLHLGFYAIMTLSSYKLVGNLHFSSQPLPTMIGWVQALLSAWALHWVYQRNKSSGAGHVLSGYVRTGVYLLIPVLLLPRAWRLYEAYFSVALWGSFAISWLMYKKLKVAALLKELKLLFIAAILSTVVISFSALSGANELPGLLAISAGILMVSVFHYIEKTLALRKINASPYYLLQLISPYFYAFAIASLSYAVSAQLAIALVMTGLFFLYLVQESRFINVIRDSLGIAYGLAWLGLVSVPILILYQMIPQAGGLSTASILIVASLVSFAGLWHLTHQRVGVYRVFAQKVFSRKIQYWIFHLLVVVGYMGALNLIFTDWSVGTTIALLIHAVILLFLTLSDKYSGLLRLSIALYIITAAKVIFHDMGDFENIHKVIALMCIGSILMAAAFIFQKLRNKQIS